MMAWRSNPLIYQGFYIQTEPLKWEEHLNWWKSRNKDWRTFIVMLDNRPIGVVTIGQLDHWSPEIGLYLGETTLWNKGYGTIVLNKAIEWIQTYSKEHSYIVACHSTILDSNKASLRLFEKCGFMRGDVARQGEIWVHKKF